MQKTSLRWILLALALVFVLSACGKAENPLPAPEKADSGGVSGKPAFSVGGGYESITTTLNGNPSGYTVCGIPYLAQHGSDFIFENPLPADAKLIQVVAAIHGTGCSGKFDNQDDVIMLSLNGSPLGIVVDPMTIQTCGPSGCDPTLTITSAPQAMGWAGYNYFGANTLHTQSLGFLTAFISLTLNYTLCGNGIVDLDETCDDGNKTPGDGCSATCAVETGYNCPTANAPCMDIDECAGVGLSCAAHASCKNIPGSAVCACNTGYEGDATNCQPCAIGTYNDTLGGSCKACIAGYFAPDSASASCTPCEKGTYAAGLGNHNCTTCPGGTATNLTGQASCPICPAGTETHFAGAATCDPCPAGKFASEPGTTVCLPCAKGYATKLTGQTACQACIPGTYASFEGALGCAPCDEGYYASGSGNEYCQPCAKGYSSGIRGSNACDVCPAGFFAPEEGSTFCSICRPGTFSSSAASASCTPCAKGYANDQIAEKTCQACAMGFFAAEEGSKTCAACPAGAFANTTGSASCKLCPKGEANNQTGRPACQACSPGFFTAVEGSETCEACNRGEFASGSANSECQACPEGTANNQLGQAECISCLAGYESRGKGAFACGPCAVGSYAPQAGTNICAKCAVGTATDQTGQTACTPCGVGSYAASIGQSACQSCPLGSYANQSGLQSCLSCPVNTYTDEVGQTACMACEKGFASAGGAAYCSPICGDGLIVGSEVCDDADTESGDGCRGDCAKIEDGWQCPTAGAPCERICTIAQHIYKEGEFNPDNKCQLCDPSQSYETWSNAALGQACNPDNLECTADVCDGSGTCFHPLTTGCLIGGNCVADGALSADSPCMACRPTLIASAYSALPYGSACPDDGVLTTFDICNSAGHCAHPTASDCTIDGVTVAAGAGNPQNACQWCDPNVTKEAYSPRSAGFACTPDELPCTEDVCDGQGGCAHHLTSGCLIDNLCVAKGAPSPQSDCLICSPDVGTNTYFALAAGTRCADDGLPATADFCNDSGVCQHQTLAACTIDGITYQGGASNPQNPCLFCDAQQSATSWSLRTPNFPCTDDGLSCTLDICDEQAQCLHVLHAGCLVANACVADGAQDPANECSTCNSSIKTDSYSPKPQGSVCADDSLSYTSDLCNAEGTCTHDKNGSCTIDSVTYAAGAANPQSICQVCDALKSAIQWSNLAEGTSCTDDNNACTKDACNAAGLCEHVAITDGACVDGDVDTTDGEGESVIDGDTDEVAESDTNDVADDDKDGAIDGDNDNVVDGDTDTQADGDTADSTDLDLDAIVPPNSSSGGGCQSGNNILAPAFFLLLIGLTFVRRRKA